MKKTIFIAVLVSVVLFAWANLGGAQPGDEKQKGLKEYMIWLQQQIEKQQKEMMEKEKPAKPAKKKEEVAESFKTSYGTAIYKILKKEFERRQKEGWTGECRLTWSGNVCHHNYKDGIKIAVTQKNVTRIMVPPDKFKALVKKGIKLEGDPAQFDRVINNEILRLAKERGVKVDAKRNLVVPFVKYLAFSELKGHVEEGYPGYNINNGFISRCAYFITRDILDGRIAEFNKLVDYFIFDCLFDQAQREAQLKTRLPHVPIVRQIIQKKTRALGGKTWPKGVKCTGNSCIHEYGSIKIGTAGNTVTGITAPFSTTINSEIPHLAQKKGIKIPAGMDLTVPFMRYVATCYYGVDPTADEIINVTLVVSEIVLDGEIGDFIKLLDCFTEDWLARK